jgi:REP element-mobilizing transposase RayT
MSTKYKFHDQERLYFITLAVVGWIDLFVRNEYRQILLDSWKYCQKNKGLQIFGWCIMTSHVHMIIGTEKDNMEDIVRDMKRHTSTALRKCIEEHPQESRREWILKLMKEAGSENSNNARFQLWRQDNHPIELFTQTVTHQKLYYIHNNPVTAGFVESPEEYLYSSAKDYYGLPSQLFPDIILIEPMVMK